MWQKFEDWWYYGDHEAMELKVSRPGLVKNVKVIRSIRAFFAIIMLIDFVILIHITGPYVFKYVSIWVYIATMIA